MLTTRPRDWIAAVTWMAACLGASGAMAASLEECRDIDAADARLACYDALAGRVEAPAEPPAPPAAPVTAPDEPAPAPAAAPQEPAAPVAAAGPEAPAGDNARFGIEQVERKAESPDVLESRLVGDYEGWFGNTRFELENGQVWRQVQSGKARYRGPPNPKVWIRKRAVGSYRLQVEGSNVGVVTVASHSPRVHGGANIAMALVDVPHNQPRTDVVVMAPGGGRSGTTCRLPFPTQS